MARVDGRQSHRPAPTDSATEEFHIRHNRRIFPISHHELTTTGDMQQAIWSALSTGVGCPPPEQLLREQAVDKIDGGVYVALERACAALVGAVL